MDIKTYSNFRKRKNSTLRPTGGNTISCSLKSPCSIENPIFLIHSNDFNIDYVEAFGNYYFVTDVVSTNRELIEIHCTIDVLATHKEEIGGYNCFIERADTGYVASDYLRDITIGRADKYINKSRSRTLVNDWWSTSVGGEYVLRTVSKDGIKSYFLTEAELKLVMLYVNNPLTLPTHFSEVFDDVDDAMKGFLYSTFNPNKYIVNCKWTNLNRSNFGTSDHVVEFGGWATNVQGAEINKPLSSGMVKELTKPTLYYNDFRDYDVAFTECNITLPGIGVVTIDPIHLKDKIIANYHVDAYTLDCRCILYDENTHVIGSWYGSLGTEYQLGDARDNWGGILSGAGSTVASAMSKDAIGMGTGLLNVFDTGANPTSNVVGTSGSAIGCQIKWFDVEVKQLASTDRPVTLGYPIGKNKTIGLHTGYVKCMGANCPINGSVDEKETVNMYLNGGFYFE